MIVKFVVSKRPIYTVSLLAALIFIASAVNPAQERYEVTVGVPQKTITAVITWQKWFATTWDEKKGPPYLADNPCWPFLISVNSAPGANTVFGATSVESRYKLEADMHVCTFNVSAPVGVPLVIEPRLRNIKGLTINPMPPSSMPVRFRYRPGFKPYSRPWTLGAKGVYLSFTYGWVGSLSF